MVIPSIISDLPSKSSAYIFGSASRSSVYNDLDILIIYDQFECPHNNAHNMHRKFVERLGDGFDTTVHLSLICYDEEKENSFIAKVSAVALIS